jgi:hypothetical protein
MYRHVGTSFAGEASKAMGPRARTASTAPRAANTPKSSAGDFRPPVRSTDLRLDPAQSAIAPREGDDVTQHTPHATTKENR